MSFTIKMSRGGRAGEMVQVTIRVCLVHKHEDLSSIPKPGMVIHSNHSIGEEEKGGALGLTGELQVPMRDCFKNLGRCLLRENT